MAPLNVGLFRFVGRIIGKAVHDGQLVDAYFTRSFYKHLLGSPLTYEDIEAVDPEYYKNLKVCGSGLQAWGKCV